MAISPEAAPGLASTSQPPAVEVADLVKTYPGGIKALQGVSFTVAPGSVFALLGPNGAGKSTIVKVLTTLSRPDRGRASVMGHDVLREPGRVRRAIGVVGQRSAVDREATGEENLRLQGQFYGMGGEALRRRVDELLERFGLAGARRRVTLSYSGGMQRKLDVAMGLIHQPRVLFLDEPTTGLDPEARADMWREIARLGRDEGLTVVLTTHYLEEADVLAHRVAIVDQGRIAVTGTPDALKGELRGDAVHVELGAPQPEAAVRAALRPLDGLLRELTLDGRSLRARADSGASALPMLLAALDGAGIHAATATVARPSLDDVYLRHTGHSFAQAERHEIKEVAR